MRRSSSWPSIFWTVKSSRMHWCNKLYWQPPKPRRTFIMMSRKLLLT